MPVAPEAQRILDAVAAAGLPDTGELSPTVARELTAVRAPIGGPGPTAHVQPIDVELAHAAIGVRVYRPVAASSAEPLPVLSWFHGGGFVLGNLEQSENDCRQLCNRIPALVISVDYRLAPEHPFPAASDDCLGVVKWARQNAHRLGGDACRMAVGGDSAGGNLAAVTALRCRDDEGPVLMAQLLVCPITDLQSMDTPSYEACASGFFLTRAAMTWFRRHYLSDDMQRELPYVSPLRAPDLTRLPPAIVLTAEYDPLRDEGEAYAARLVHAGVPTTLRRYDGMIHGFFSMHPFVPAGFQAIIDASRELRRLLHPPS